MAAFKCDDAWCVALMADGTQTQSTRTPWHSPHLQPQGPGQTRHPAATRWFLLYLVVLTILELAAAQSFVSSRGEDASVPLIGLLGHFWLMLALLVFGTYELRVRLVRPAFGKLLTSLALVSMLRILSLAVPRFFGVRLDLFSWLVLMAFPLLLGAWTVMRVNDEMPSDYRWLPKPTFGGYATEIIVILTGIPLGLAEYEILARTAIAPPGAPVFDGFFDVFVAVFGIFVATAVFEELVFRGFLQRHVSGFMRPQWAIFWVSVLFAVLHVINQSWQDVLFVFGVGWFYGQVVLRTGNLGGVIGSHAMVNIMLFLILPSLRAA